MGKPIKATPIPKTGAIKPTVLTEGLVTFSFKYLDLAHPKFGVSRKDAKYFMAVLNRLKAVSTIKADELRANRSRGLRAHPIHWAATSEKAGFTNLNAQLRDNEGYQFEISSNEHGRVHGLFLDTTFFVVWLDPNHSLYP